MNLPKSPFRIVGPAHSPRAHRLRDDLSRASVPYWYFDHESAEGRQLLHEHDLEGRPLPVVLARNDSVLVNPSHEDLMAKLGFRSSPALRACDVAIVGACPAGLAAAVYATSEGLSTVILEPEIPGGQAGTSSLIRNYLGFPHGLPGDDLTARALDQAWLFGANFTTATAEGLTVRDGTRPGTCGTGPSSVSPRPSGKAPPPSSLCTNTCGPSKTNGGAGLEAPVGS